MKERHSTTSARLLRCGIGQQPVLEYPQDRVVRLRLGTNEVERPLGTEWVAQRNEQSAVLQLAFDHQLGNQD